MKKFLLGFIAVILSISFASSAYALTLDSGEYPDLPEGYSNGIIYEENNTTYLLATEDEALETYNISNIYMKELTDNSNIYTAINGDNTEIGWAVFHVYELSNNSWSEESNQTKQLSLVLNELVYTSINFIDFEGNITYASGYGTTISGLFEGVTTVATGFFGTLASVTSALIGNSIFQIAFAIGIIFITIGIIYSLLRKVRNRGR